jgi:hypothetical protein
MFEAMVASLGAFEILKTEDGGRYMFLLIPE